MEHIITEQIPHGKICIGFTPDEEIGAGADYFDVTHFGADYAYTLDGDLEGNIEYENFNASGNSCGAWQQCASGKCKRYYGEFADRCNGISWHAAKG